MGIPTIINYVIYGLSVLLLLLGFLLGMRRGVCRQSVKLATVILSAVISFLIFGGFFPNFLAYLEGRTLYDFISGTLAPFGVAIPENLAAWLGCFESSTGAYALAIPAAVIIVPLLFVICFFLLKALLAIPYVILCGVFGFTKKNNNGLTRLLGGAVGLLQGFVVLAIMLLPFAGALGIADEAMRSAEEKHPDSTNTVVLGNAYHQNVEPIKNNIAIRTTDACFGFIYDSISTIEVDGNKVSMNEVASDGLNLFVLYGDLAGMDKNAIGEEYKLIIDEMVQTLGDDKYMSELVAGLMRGVSRAEAQGIFVSKNGDEHIDAFTKEFFTLFETSDYTTVKGDIITFKDFFFVLSDAGTLKQAKEGADSMFETLLATDENGDTTVALVCKTLEANPRTAHLASMLTTMAMDVLLGTVTDNPDAAKTITEVKDTLNTIVAIDKESYASEAEYKAAVSAEIGKTLDSNNIALDEGQLNEITEFVVTEFEGVDEVSDADLASFMSEYYNIKAGAGASAPVIP
jgi:uncharacterized membrane protein required for colicin V production